MSPIMIGVLMAKGKGKRYPVQRNLELGGIAGGSTWYTVDVAKHLSEQNHRLYRQSRVYKCKVNHLGNCTDRGAVDVYVLRDTWMLQKAYQMAKDVFDKNMTEERAVVSKSNLARWQDFRINLAPKASGVSELLPISRANGTLNTSTMSNGEFDVSVTYKEDGSAMDFGFYGTSTRWSIVEEYDKTADTESSPDNTVSGSAINSYGLLDDDNQQTARDDLQTRGNSPPYDPNSLDGAALFRRVATIGATSGHQKYSTGYFDAPLGLVLLVATNTASSDDFFEVEVQSGDYKGVHAPSYVEAKKFGHRKA